MATNTVTGVLNAADGRKIPLSSEIAESTEATLQTATAFTVTAQDIGDYMPGARIVSGLITALNGISYAYILRQGLILATIPVCVNGVASRDTPIINISNSTKAVTLQVDTNQKLTVKGALNTFVLDVSSATSGLTFPDGTIQTTAASGSGGVVQPSLPLETPSTYTFSLLENPLLEDASKLVEYISTWDHEGDEEAELRHYSAYYGKNPITGNLGHAGDVVIINPKRLVRSVRATEW